VLITFGWGLAAGLIGWLLSVPIDSVRKFGMLLGSCAPFVASFFALKGVLRKHRLMPRG
jgi:hypothetical protein